MAKSKESGFSSGGAGLSKKIKSAMESKDFKSLKEHMASIGVNVAPSMEQLPLDAAKDACYGIELVVREIPALQKIVRIDYDQERTGRAYAVAGFYGRISVGDIFRTGSDSLEKHYQSDVSSRFHPKGTSAIHITSHEVGHAIEGEIIRRHPELSNQAKAWNNSTMATRIVRQAATQVKKTPYGKGKTNDQLVYSVSRYAKRNRSEALAECVADYISNGSKSNPLSQAVWGIIKKELT